MGTDQPFQEPPAHGSGGALVVLVGSLVTLAFLVLVGGFQ